MSASLLNDHAAQAAGAWGERGTYRRWGSRKKQGEVGLEEPQFARLPKHPVKMEKQAREV
jgi:hypothetical protein